MRPHKDTGKSPETKDRIELTLVKGNVVTTMKNVTAINIAALTAGVTAAAFCLGGCGNDGRERHAPLRVFTGIDASESARKGLGAYVLLTTQMANRLTPNRDHLTLYRVDHDVQEFSDKPVAGGTDALTTAIVREVQQVTPTRNTLPAKFWGNVAARAEAQVHTERDTHIVVVLFTDGDNDDQTAGSKAALKEAARRLGALPQVSAVIIAGVERRSRAYLRDCFDAPLGARLHLIGAGEMEIGVLAKIIAEARQARPVAEHLSKQRRML
jgi:hypothetical protein